MASKKPSAKTANVTRKTRHVVPAPSSEQKPELHSILRLGHRVVTVKDDINTAFSDGGQVALGLAKGKILDSPTTNKTFKKSVAKAVDFGPDEKLFNKLVSLNLSGDLDPKVRPPLRHLPPPGLRNRDPEPTLSDFHEPFQGQDIPHVADRAALQAVVDKVTKSKSKSSVKSDNLDQSEPRKRFQDRFRR